MSGLFLREFTNYMNNKCIYLRMHERKNYPWVVVGLLWFVVMLNYIDRQMLSTMKPSMMIDIAELQTAANFGRLMLFFSGSMHL
jgi:hypothetical protein